MVVQLVQERVVVVGQQVGGQAVAAVIRGLLHDAGGPVCADVAQRLENDTALEATAGAELYLENVGRLFLLATDDQRVDSRQHQMLAAKPVGHRVGQVVGRRPAAL